MHYIFVPTILFREDAAEDGTRLVESFLIYAAFKPLFLAGF